jgi:hypothetical protein
MTEEVARVISAPRINIGRWCALLAVVMWYGGKAGAWRFVVDLPGGNVWGMLYMLLTFGFAIRAGHDLLMWLAQANDALNEKRKFESLGMSAAVQWAHEKDMRDAANGVYKGDPKAIAEATRWLEAKHGKL